MIVGLGNPGSEYARSRHNVGFVVVDAVAKQAGLKFSHRWAHALVAVGRVAGRDAALAKPQTFMNLSGDSVRSLLRHAHIGPEAILVVYDDLDLPLGRIRIRERGSSGGHRGVQSIIDRLASDAFPRLRVGIGRPEPRDAADYVLAGFTPEERPALDDAIARSAAAVEVFLAEGLPAAMNRYNR
jgi:PTH1 family peptidyl-tRNA hydrolase